MKEPVILVLSGVRGDTRRYRIYHTFEQLNFAGVPCLLSDITDASLLTKLSCASLVIFHRVIYDRYVEKLFQIIRERAILPVYDTDDLIFKPEAFHWIDSPDFQDPIRAALYQENIRRNRNTLDECAAVITSTAYLSEQIQGLGKPVWVHRNAFSQELLDLSEQAFRYTKNSVSKVVIGYASGTATHDRDFEFVKPILLQVLKNYLNVEVWIIGPVRSRSGWGKYEERVKHFPLVPWRQLPGWLAQFSINIAPLVADNPFAQSKSEIKYVEAALVRVPTIASPTESYQFAIQSGENGFIATNQKEWIEALEKLIINPNLRKDMGENAHKDVLCRYHPATRSVELVDTLNGIIRSTRTMPIINASVTAVSLKQVQANPARSQRWFSDLKIERQPSYVRMAIYSLKHRSLWTMLRQAWIYFRRLIAPVFPYKSSRKAEIAD